MRQVWHMAVSVYRIHVRLDDAKQQVLHGRAGCWRVWEDRRPAHRRDPLAELQTHRRKA
ncbi:hypothetical protein VB151_13580 [Xanthomonas fragariae]|uniref:hypothetical protein n=2 Tax=Xanthomonas fragariae TaxID=48664 RepID=UPI0012F76B85|nr:hypothetical protein [Xanthomonas fragariae]MDM7582435.1 hypothetical protein [Xanthomonas fragariae]MDM7588983.1 hypothetical protein [Xanthomonas fragariae]MEA5174706.1 hypothetical protein [Xanthomonas fragariae]MEA5211507.1 hypothetical protein [Xanthomonas fragariae]MEA5220011.1 hypothetical protein [Xanthomonas fragariae]